MSKFKLLPGPKLERHHWAYDETSATGEWQANDVTDRAVEFLFCNVELDPEITLADIFKLIRVNPMMQLVFRQEFVAELCAEAEKGPVSPRGEAWEQLEYLELYQVWSLDTSTWQYSRVGRFQFHGMGIVQEADITEYGYVHHKKGERSAWSISLTPVRELLHLPVRIRAEALLCEDDLDARDYGKTLSKGINTEITLGTFIRESLWELSFHGSPEECAKIHDELLKQVDEVKSDTVETARYEDIFESLGLNSRNTVYDQFFEAWNQFTSHEVYCALHEVADDTPIQQGLLAGLGTSIEVKPEYAALPARQFRKLVRLAQCETA